MPDLCESTRILVVLTTHRNGWRNEDSNRLLMAELCNFFTKTQDGYGARKNTRAPLLAFAV